MAKGRKALDEGAKYTEAVFLRFTPGQHAALKELADEENIPLAVFLRARILKTLVRKSAAR